MSYFVRCFAMFATLLILCATLSQGVAFAGSGPYHFPSPVASSTSTHQAQPNCIPDPNTGNCATCYRTPTAAFCNGNDPITTSCGNDAITATANDIYDGNGNYLGTIELRYSPHCGTNWARVTSSIGQAQLVASIGYGGCGSGDKYQDNGSGTIVYSRMVYAPNDTAHANGNINGGNGCTAG